MHRHPSILSADLNCVKHSCKIHFSILQHFCVTKRDSSSC